MIKELEVLIEHLLEHGSCKRSSHSLHIHYN